jgi:hypothetical protein
MAAHDLAAECIVKVVSPPMAHVQVNGSDGPLTLQDGANYTLSWSSQAAQTCWSTGWTNTVMPPTGPAGSKQATLYSAPIREQVTCSVGAFGVMPQGVSNTVLLNTTTPAVATTASGNNAACLEIVAPLEVHVGEVFDADVTMLNSGSKPWETDASPHRLAAVKYGPGVPREDNPLWGLMRQGLPNTVLPGEAVTFHLRLTAPLSATQPGEFPYLFPYFDWQMVEDGVEFFGQACRTTVLVIP